jgi:hypothetical protein
MAFRLTGDSLVTFVTQEMQLVNRGEITRTDLIQAAGYVDGNRTLYTDFYTELLRAKGVTPVTDTDTADVEYAELTKDEQELYDKVDQMFGEKWTHEEVMNFMEELNDIGIETADQMEDSFYFLGEDPWKAEEEFAKYFYLESLSENVPESLEYYINWQAVYDGELKHNFNSVDFDGSTYFFRNN